MTLEGVVADVDAATLEGGGEGGGRNVGREGFRQLGG